MRLQRTMVRLLLALVTAGAVGAGAGLVWLYAQAGTYGLNVLLQRGGTYWVSVDPGGADLSPSMRLALREEVPAIEAEPPGWRPLAGGFEVAEMPIRAGGTEVDRFLLARIDPGRFRLVARTAPAGDRDLQGWMRHLGATLVVNGSYYDRRGAPDTPLISDGVLLGPRDYVAGHGAFIATGSGARIVDLAGSDWRDVLGSAEEGFVSYPLLLARDGSNRVRADRRWLANRSFVGEDSEGRIVIGTTSEAFFSLDRLASFLRNGPLALSVALNLDGGPVACQAIELGSYHRDVCGAWETKTEEGQMRLLRWPFWWRRFSLPIVLAVLPR